MKRLRSRILVVDEPEGPLSLSLRSGAGWHEMDFARDAFDAIDRIEAASRPYDVILCDLARAELPGPELWAYLSVTFPDAAGRMAFVSSAPLLATAEAFLACIANRCVALPVDVATLVALARPRLPGSRYAPTSRLTLARRRRANAAS